MKRSWLRLLKCSPFLPSPPPIPKTAADSAETEGEEKPLADRRKPGGWKCMPFIIGNETFERVATFGLTANLTVYLVKRLHMDQVSAANAANIFGGTTNFAPLLGAFLSDAYWGRFRTLAFASVATLLGMVVLTMTASLPVLLPPKCSPADLQVGHCVMPSKSQLGVLILSLVLLTLGSAGVRPCSLPFGVDQFDGTTEAGRRSLNSFFNWYYCTSTAGVVVALTLIVYIQDSISWAIGFGVSSGLMLIAVIIFFLGTKVYVYVAPEGSVFSGIVQVFVASVRKRALELPSPTNVERQESQLYNTPIKHERVTKLPLTLQFRCLNKAAIKCEGDLKGDGTPANRWTLCTIQQIEEVKCLLRIVPIWASGIVCFIALAQQWTFAVLQSLTMDRHMGPHFQIPPATMGVISLISLTVFIPVYDRILMPVARRFTGLEAGITLLQRQGIGMVLAVLSMVVAGLVEEKRRNSALAHAGMSPLSALWLAPQLVLMGVAEAFNAVGQIEFYNRQFPEHMQTLAGALFYCTLAGANYMSSILVTVIHRRTNWLGNNINAGRVDYFYYVIAGMGLVNLLYFLVCSHFYRYKALPEVVAGDQEEETVLIP